MAIRTKSRLMLALVRQLLPVVEVITAYNREIERLFFLYEDNEVFRSLPRAGKLLAPRLLAAIGDHHKRYVDAMGLQAQIGTVVVPYESGKYPRLYQPPAQCDVSVCPCFLISIPSFFCVSFLDSAERDLS